MRVIVRDEKIFRIEPSAAPLDIAVDKTIDASGQFMVPGFSDTHFHPSPKPEENELLNYLLVANGITSVLTMGERFGENALEIKRQASNQSPFSPNYYVAGQMQDASTMPTPEKAREVVRFHRNEGYDFLKVHGNLEKETLLALLEEAEELKVPVIGHAQRHLPLGYTLRQTSIAHMEDIVMVFSDEEKMLVPEIGDEQASVIARQVKESGIYVTPTLGVDALINQYSAPDSFQALIRRPETAFLHGEGDAIKSDYTSEFFPRINDRYGHQIGDDVLTQFATLLQRSIRSEVDWVVCSVTAGAIAEPIDWPGLLD